ncbi:MAG: NUDIX hydrolase [Pseudonocardiaceae bacterium]
MGSASSRGRLEAKSWLIRHRTSVCRILPPLAGLDNPRRDEEPDFHSLQGEVSSCVLQSRSLSTGRGTVLRRRADSAACPKRSLPRRIVRVGAWLLREKHTIGAFVAIHDMAGRLLLVRQKLYQRDMWTLPGGFVKSGERPSSTAAREVSEEVGISLDIKDSDEVAHWKQHWANHIDVLYCLQLPNREPAVRISFSEISEARWFDIDADQPLLSLEAKIAYSVLKGVRPGYLQMFWWADGREHPRS